MARREEAADSAKEGGRRPRISLSASLSLVLFLSAGLWAVLLWVFA